MFQDNNTLVPLCTTTFAHAWSGGGATTIQEVMVDAGYWRATKDSTEVLPCYNVDACVGGITGDLKNCAMGYEGPCKLSRTAPFICAYYRTHKFKWLLTSGSQPHGTRAVLVLDMRDMLNILLVDLCL